MTGGDGVTAEDALRTLNTDILAGNGPDLLVLDGMDVAAYWQKGMLEDLSGLLQEVDGEEGLLGTVANTWRDEEGVPAVPVQFGIPLAAGSSDSLDGIADLEALCVRFSEERALAFNAAVQLPEILSDYYSPIWKEADGSIREEILEACASHCKELYDASLQAADVRLQEFLADRPTYLTQMREMLEEEGLLIGDMAGMGLSLLDKGTDAIFGILRDMDTYCLISSALRQIGEGTLLTFAKEDQTITTHAWEIPAGEEPENLSENGLYYPLTSVGILSGSAGAEQARDFLRYLLSREGSLQFNRKGFSVNRAALLETLSTNPNPEGSYWMSSGDAESGEMVELEVTWMEEDEQAQLTQLIESLAVPAVVERIPSDTVTGEVRRYMTGESTLEEAVQTIRQKLQLYLAEHAS